MAGLCVPASCGTQPGQVVVSFSWGEVEPPETVWIHGRVVQRNPDAQGIGQIVSELDVPSRFSAGMSLAFDAVQNQDNLAVLVEARGNNSLDSRALYYGMSAPFTLAAGDESAGEIVVVMKEVPLLYDLAIEDAVGPLDCPECYVPEEETTLHFKALRAVRAEVANDADFQTCARSLEPGGETGGTHLSIVDGNEWRIAGWNLDCDLRDASDGPRSVYVRLFDELGYVSQMISKQVVLDRQPPSRDF